MDRGATSLGTRYFEVNRYTPSQSAGGGVSMNCRDRARKVLAGPSPESTARACSKQETARSIAAHGSAEALSKHLANAPLFVTELAFPGKQFIDPHRLVLALDTQQIEFADFHEVARQAAGLLADEDATRIPCRRPPGVRRG